MAKRSGENSYDTKPQKVLQKLFPACNEVHGCDECPYDEGDYCFKINQVMNNKSENWWEKEFEKLEVYERRSGKKELPPKPIRPVVEELLITCPNCRVQEVITLSDFMLESTVKFNQVMDTLTVLHHCGKGDYCEVTLPDGETTVADYIRETREEELEKAKHRTEGE